MIFKYPPESSIGPSPWNRLAEQICEPRHVCHAIPWRNVSEQVMKSVLICLDLLPVELILVRPAHALEFVLDVSNFVDLDLCRLWEQPNLLAQQVEVVDRCPHFLLGLGVE